MMRRSSGMVAAESTFAARHGRPAARVFAIVASALSAASLAGAADPPARGPEAIRDAAAIQPAAPVVPGDVVAAMQEGKYDAAEGLLATLAAKADAADDRAYLNYLRAVAQRLAGRRKEAIETLQSAMKASPGGSWVPKIRYELAGLEMAAGNLAAAEELSRNEAIRLLADDRKDRLAEVYHAHARHLLQPDDPILQPDPNGAWELLNQARDLAKSPTLRAQLLFSMGKASQQAGNDPRAIENFQAYLREYPGGADRFAAKYRLGEVQRHTNALLPARLTWTDLAREIEKLPPQQRTRDADSIRADALAGIPSTYGIPTPQDDANLSLGVAALRRCLAAYPSHRGAVRAAYEVGASYLARGKSDAALEAFRQFLKGDEFRVESDEARRDQAELLMTATFQSAQILQGQQKYAEAIAGWRGYLGKFPNGPQSADAQRAILDTELLVAADHLARERYAEARAAWNAFVAGNPLDPRVPELLFQVGESFAKEKKYDEAIASWGPLTTKFPASEPAAHAQFLTASLFESEKADPAGAIERFRKIAVEPWKSQALQHVAVMESLALAVMTPRAFRTGETPGLKITSRNLEKLTFTAYRLNAEAYFRKKHGLGNVESLDIGLVAPDAEWTSEVPGYAKYRPVEATYELKSLERPAVYVVKVTDQKHLQATTLVVSSDIEAVLKTSRDQVLVFAQDMKTGKGRPRAKVLLSDGGQVVLEAETGADGVLIHDWSPARPGSSHLAYLILDGGNVAGSGLAVPEKVSQGLSPRAYIYADRPAYRPGQTVAVRGVVREVQNGQYANVPGALYRFEVTDSRGRQLVSRNVTLSEFGTFRESFPIDRGAPVGTYRIRAYQPGKSEFSGAFEVQSYQLEPIELAFDLKKSIYYRGEAVETDVVAKYQYGAPVAGRPIEVNLPDGRILHGETDNAGKFHLGFSTDAFAEDASLRIVARLTQDNVEAGAVVMLATRGFDIGLRTRRDVFLDGESFPVTATTTDAKGAPIGQSLSLSVIKMVTQAGRVTEREVERKTVATDAKTGTASLTFRVDDKDGGSFRLRAAGSDQFGNPIVTDHAIYISGKKDENHLRILADRQQFKLGEQAEVNLHSRGRAGTALLTWEADKILSYKLVTLKEGDNPLAWPVDGPQFPNFTLTASRMWENTFDQAKLDVQVERELTVTVKPVRPTVGPGEEVELEVTAADQLGRPAAAELSIAMIDRALLRLHPDRMPAIASFFYDQTRTGAFSTESSNTFRYVPATVPVARAVVDEAERIAAVAANAADRKDVQQAAQSQVALSLPAPSAPGDPDRLQAKGAMMGGYGGAGGAPAEAAGRRELASKRRSAGARDKRKADVSKDAEGSGYFQQLRGEAGEASAEDFDDRVALGDAPSNQPGSPRQRFVETAYWNPSVVTGKDGKGRVAFKAPGSLSDYLITARGVTGGDTLVGQTTTSLTIRKDFFVDLKAPGALTQGDRPRVIARVHHVGVIGTVDLRLTVYGGGREEVFPKALEIKGDGVDEVLMDGFETPDTDSVRLTLAGTLGASRDEVTAEIPVRPWGVQAYASESGTTSDGTAVFVGLPKGRAYESPEMVVLISPTLRRMLIELAMGRESRVDSPGLSCRIAPPPANTTADRAADLLAATSALAYLRATRSAGSPDVQRITSRIQGLVAELTAAQNEDGGWPWVAAGPIPRQNEKAPAAVGSERLTSAAVFWSLSAAEQAGLVPDAKVLDKAAGWLTQAVTAGTSSRDLDARATILHALSTRHAATFEMANSLNRERQVLSNAALAYLALTFANLSRPELGGELAAILVPRAKVEPTAPGRPSRLYWEGSGQSANARGSVETTALVSLALARVRPNGNELDRAAEWLHAHRFGYGWNPHRAKGAAVAALALYHGRSKGAEDRYRLTVTVNDAKVAELDVAGAGESREIRVPTKALKAGDANRVGLAMEGRGTFSYSVTMTGFSRDFGPDQDRTNRPAWVDRRVYWPAPRELDGKVLPSNFSVAVNPSTWENTISQVPLGGKSRVGLVVWRNVPDTTPEWERDFLVVEEQLPAGTTLIAGSVITSASSYTLADGVLTFYFAPDQNPGGIQYDVYGYLPGQYRALPTSVRSAYDPGRSHLGQPSDFKVLSPGEKNTDEYRVTPDELYAAGKIHFDAGRYAEAAASLEPLFAAYTLREDVLKDAARMLLLINIAPYDARKVVQYFEVVKEKAPELILDFDKLLVIGKAYRDINEYERATIVWRGLIEASYLEDARVGELLRQRGKTLEATAYLIGLWRTYPNTPSIESDFFGLSQILAKGAAEAFTEPRLRAELAAAGVTRSQLLLQTIRMVQVFLSQSPTNPMADEASLALVNAFIELEDYEGVVKLAGRFAATYPRSSYLDAFQYSEALANFHLGRYDRAVEVAEKISRAVYKDASGVDQPSPNKWQAIYILGQIFDARRVPAKAVDYYKQVADRFTDAASAIQFYTRKELRVPEVSIVRPQPRPAVAGAEGPGPRPPTGLRAVGLEPAGAGVEGLSKPGIKLEYRNIAKAEVTAYPVDLMQLYLARRNLNAIAGIDLAGITPLVEKSVVLGSGSDYEDSSKVVDLPLTKEGAYLVMIRGDNLYASGIVLVSPIDVETLEEPAAGRVRVTVRDARTRAALPKVQVKVIGTNNGDFFSGETDLRGVFVAEGVQGHVTAVARKDASQYAFYRGTNYVGSPPVPATPPPAANGQPAAGAADSPINQALDVNLKIQNSSNYMRQIQRLENRYNTAEPGKPRGAAAGGFR
ncbi:Outer membrane protein assembly factor BamD [Aquisphaera giovannonii]|uniref:Outer membrane protein assembly factor BamD n=1 Tax=Aquisphaera giovannonii TaxID=406548 RepID=A0A5B9W0Z4_9BACT|nr:MG2 domain-containing protein [Aquisphaera giovannonii]QEH33600.1 Outer membrane protein assembly factor BamD [Aquisphaera giovannonii]